MPSKQKNGLYRARIKIGVDAAGKDVYKYVSGKTKKELEQNRQQAVKFYITGTSLNDDRLFGEYAQEWFQLRLKPNASASTIESYRITLNKHILPVFAERNLRAIRPLEIQTFLDGFAGKSATLITYVHATFKKIYKAAMTDRIVDHDPTISVTKPAATPAAEKPVLTPEQRGIIAHVCETHPKALYLALMFYLGVRPGEALGLQWGDVDWFSHTISIQRDIDFKAGGNAGSLKTEKSKRTVPVPDPLYALLSRNRNMPELYIVRGEISGSSLSKTASERLWTELMDACGMTAPALPNNRHRADDIRSRKRALITPHTLRHNFVTMCWENDIDAFTTSKLVGHSNVNTTLRIYTHLTEQKQRMAAQRLNQIFASVPNIESVPSDSEKIVPFG